MHSTILKFNKTKIRTKVKITVNIQIFQTITKKTTTTKVKFQLIKSVNIQEKNNHKIYLYAKTNYTNYYRKTMFK